MMHFNNLNNDERGQTALETAIILIAFVVVASVFAFAILSAGQSSTERGEEAIYSGLEGVQSSLSVRGAVLATTTDATAPIDAESVVVNLALVSGGAPVDLTDVVFEYRDATQRSQITVAAADIDYVQENTPANNLLEEGELVEITLDTPAIPANTEFTIAITPPTGGVLAVSRTTPAAITAVTELR